MPFLNSNLPPFYCYLRKEFLYNLESHHGEYIDVCVFGVSSIPGRALGFHCYTDEGAMFWRLPIHAICWKCVDGRALEVIECWDALSYDLSVIAFEQLKGMQCKALLKDQKEIDAEYMMTIDFCKSETAEGVGDGGHKCAHLLKLDDGNFGLQPNNRIFWKEPAFITRPLKERPDYITNGRLWSSEGSGKWVTEDSEKYFYNYEVRGGVYDPKIGSFRTEPLHKSNGKLSMAGKVDLAMKLMNGEIKYNGEPLISKSDATKLWEDMIDKYTPEVKI